MASLSLSGIELTREQQQKVNKCADIYMIGRLPINRTATTYDNIGNVKFFLDALCNEPDIIVSTGIADDTGGDYVGFDSHQSSSMLPYTYNLDSYDYESRQDDIEDYYGNQLIVFHPEYTKNRNINKWFKNFYITSLFQDNLEEYVFFETVPRTQMEVAKFEEVLKKGDYFELDGFDGDIYDSPKLILCGPYAYKIDIDVFSDEPFLTCNPNFPTRWKCNSSENVKKIELSKLDHYRTSIIRASENVSFVESTLYSDIMKNTDYILFEEERKAALIKESQEKKPVINVEDQAEDETEDVAIANQLIENSEEILFIDALQQVTLDNGLQYKRNDLINFHISVKTTPLTILAGMSGTGKSRLAMNYAKMLDLSEDNGTLLFMPISPSYTEPSDVLGYLNSMNGLYVPSESGLVQFLIHAQNNLDQMHMVIFDEMNLSQVEYWFSPFISILEKDLGERILKLYDEDARCINEKVYPPSLKIGENVVFVGTVNIDDTTKNFSDRLLDRTFVINLGMVSFTDFLDDYLRQQNVLGKADIMRAKCKNVNQFISWCHGTERNYMEVFKDNRNELEFFDELNQLIKNYIPEGGISHRVMKNIGNYILNVPVKDRELIIPRSDVLDTVINQTVMTKIRGTETQLQKLVGTLDENDELVDSELIDLLKKYEHISQYTQIKKSLIKKAKELMIDGYTN